MACCAILHVDGGSLSLSTSAAVVLDTPRNAHGLKARLENPTIIQIQQIENCTAVLAHPTHALGWTGVIGRRCCGTAIAVACQHLHGKGNFL
eukprot:4694338-Amphidinium_carterae.1